MLYPTMFAHVIQIPRIPHSITVCAFVSNVIVTWNKQSLFFTLLWLYAAVFCLDPAVEGLQGVNRW